MIRQEVLFSAEECKAILDLAGEFHSSKVTRRNSNPGEDSFIFEDLSARVTEESSPSDLVVLSDIILPKVEHLGIISLPKDCYLLKYNVGGKFIPHKDREPDVPETADRVYTFIIQLTEGSEYTGGNLFIGQEKVNSTQGSVVLFDSNLMHNVTPVKSGQRHSFVAWLRDYNLKIEKSAI